MVKRRFNVVRTAKYLIENYCEKVNGDDLHIRCKICGEEIIADTRRDLYRFVYRHFKTETRNRAEHYKALVISAYRTAQIILIK